MHFWKQNLLCCISGSCISHSGRMGVCNGIYIPSRCLPLIHCDLILLGLCYKISEWESIKSNRVKFCPPLHLCNPADCKQYKIGPIILHTLHLECAKYQLVHIVCNTNSAPRDIWNHVSSGDSFNKYGSLIVIWQLTLAGYKRLKIWGQILALCATPQIMKTKTYFCLGWNTFIDSMDHRN